MTSGFLPQEREWFDRLLETGWHDYAERIGDQFKGPILGGRIEVELEKMIKDGE